jgi:hypothetical protein
MSTQTLTLSLLGLLLGACASYTPSSAPVPEPAPAEWIIQNTLAVAADPFEDAESQSATFDADLNEADVISIQVIVENRGPQAVLVRPSDMILELPDGKKFSPASSG